MTLSGAENIQAIVKGMYAAHRAVVEKAKQTGIPLVVWRDGKVVEMTGEEIEQEMIQKQKNARDEK